MKPKAAVSWSGGKDSCAALLRARDAFEPVVLITMVAEDGARSRSHGLRPEILAAQAEAMGLPRIEARCTWETYDDSFGRALDQLPADVNHVIFGDILFDEHRLWAERMCAAHGRTAVEPLFGSATRTLFLDWIRSGAVAAIVTARCDALDREWLGRTLREGMLPAFVRLGIDPCGERGEYHTVVADCALFRAPLRLQGGEVVRRGGCWAMDFTIAEAVVGA